MKAFVTSLIRNLLLLLSLLLLPTTAPLLAQVEQTQEDSTRVTEEIRAEQANLMQELQQLREELARAKALTDESEREEAVYDAERRIGDIEQRLEALERSLDGGDTDDWETGDEDWSDEWDSDDDSSFVGEWGWWSDDEEDDDFDRSFFKKYPGNFPWSFPLTTRLHETFLRYNRVEGLYIGIAQPKRLYWHSRPWLVSTGSLGYGFANHTWRYSLGLYLPVYLEDQIIEIGGEGHSFTDSKDQWTFDRDENTLTAIVAREDFLDYFERRGYTVNASWYLRGENDLNIRASFGYAHDTYANMNRATNWSIFGGDKEFRRNPLINDGNVNSIVFSAGVSTLASLDERDRGWDAQLQFEKAGDFAGGDFAFSQWLVDLRRYQPLSEHLNLNLRFRGVMSDGTVPQQRAVELGGPGTLPGYRYKEFAGSNIALVNAEFIIRSTIVGNARGWARQVLSNTNIILFADAGTTNLPTMLVTRDVRNGAISEDSDSAFRDEWKSDAGVAFGSANGDFRIGAAWRLDRSESPTFLIRLSRPF